MGKNFGVFRLDLNGQAPVSSGSSTPEDVSSGNEQSGDGQPADDKPVEDMQPNLEYTPDRGLPPNTMLIVGGVVLVMAIIGGVLFIVLRRARY